MLVKETSPFWTISPMAGEPEVVRLSLMILPFNVALHPLPSLVNSNL